MVAEPWILRMGNQVSANLKHALLLEQSGKRKCAKQKETLGILSFEVANVMSKTVHLYKSLADPEISKLKREILTSEGILYLVSEEEPRLLSLALAEKLEDLDRIAGVVSRLGRKCTVPALQGFEHVYGDIVSGVIEVRALGFLVKDMEGMVRKMERYVQMSSNLHGHLEMLNEMERGGKKFQQNQHEESHRAFEQKLLWQKQDVNHLKNISLWDQSFDKAVEFLARTVCTIYARICVVFGESVALKGNNLCPHGGNFPLSNHELQRNSGSIDVEGHVHLVSQQLKRVHSKSRAYNSGGLKGNNLCPRGENSPPSNHELERNSGPIDVGSRVHSTSQQLKRVHSKSRAYNSEQVERLAVKKREPHHGLQRFDVARPDDFRLPCGTLPSRLFLDCLSLSSSASKIDDDFVDHDDRHSQSSSCCNTMKDFKREGPCSQISGLFSSGDRRISRCSSTNGTQFGRRSRLAAYASPCTVGGSALAPHYANVIIVIEKLLRYPHLVGDEARADLYQMLPASLKMSLRAKLKAYVKNLAIYDAPLAHDWKETLDGILRWLAPLAHNMIRWQSERNFEQQQVVTRTNVLLLQTLYFADREKTEMTICELLVGLNYICRYEQQQNALLDCASSFDFDDCTEWQLYQ